jgi:hypothetical protein
MFEILRFAQNDRKRALYVTLSGAKGLKYCLLLPFAPIPRCYVWVKVSAMQEVGNSLSFIRNNQFFSKNTFKKSKNVVYST